MKKGLNLAAEKILDSKINKKSHQEFKFELSPHTLDCFKGKQRTIKSKYKMETLRDFKNVVNKKPEAKINELSKSLSLTSK